MYALTQTSLKNLKRAKLAFITEQCETSSNNPPCGGKWATDLSFEECKILAGRSFTGNDRIKGEPTIDWITEPVLSLSSLKERIDLYSFLMSFALREAWARKCVIFAILDDSVAAKQETEDGKKWKGAVIVRECDAVKESWWLVKLLDNTFEIVHFVTELLFGHVPSIIFKKGHLIKKQASSFLSSLTPNHKKYGPKNPHWYVHMVMTNPNYQGQGVGSSLMTRIGELADAENVDCYLECCGETLKRFYEKFGYQTMGSATFQNVVLPEGRSLTRNYMIRPRRNSGAIA